MGGGGGGWGHTLSHPGYLPVCRVDIHTVFSESDNFFNEQ